MLYSSNKKFTIAVEGNIGSGKSTILTHLSKIPLCEIVGEPLDKWTNLKGDNILDMFYSDPHRWSFAFQSHVLLTIAKLHTQPSRLPIKVMERSIFSARYCFIENLHRNKCLQTVEYEILKGWFDMLTSDDSCHLDLIIYLRAKPETCLQRIRARNRIEEQPITLDYVNQLHELHEQWLSPETRSMKTPVIIIDANQAKEQVYSDADAHITNLMSC